MYIKEINIENFKCFNGVFNIKFNEKVNILVGNNEAGKSTIIEAINLALTGIINGRYLRNELNHYLFNDVAVKEYLDALNPDSTVDTLPPPKIRIELFIAGDDLPEFEGDGNSEKKDECCIIYEISFNPDLQNEYEDLIKTENLRTLPIEYYHVVWQSCSRQHVTVRSIPLKPALIDSSNARYNGSDMYISRIVRDFLEPEDKIAVTQAHRKMKEAFIADDSMKEINNKLQSATQISEKKVSIDVDLSSNNAWENTLTTYLDNIPFHYIGKGEQAIIKTRLAMGHTTTQAANVILLEEPENHLSHTKLNELLSAINPQELDKQLIVTTHNSFVANKLNLNNLILLYNQNYQTLSDLNPGTQIFFHRIAGYNTLRLVLSQKAILVEGDSDELIVQRAYMDSHDGKLPIDDGIDVISVGTAFLRFLEIADKLQQPVSVVTDTDGNLDAVRDKYTDYLFESKRDYINICFDEEIDGGDLELNGKPFNYNTLEPKLLKANGLEKMNRIMCKNFSEEEMLKYMQNNKTLCAIKIFESEEQLSWPDYILESFQNE